jgi:hypothetical protein
VSETGITAVSSDTEAAPSAAVSVDGLVKRYDDAIVEFSRAE